MLQRKSQHGTHNGAVPKRGYCVPESGDEPRGHSRLSTKEIAGKSRNPCFDSSPRTAFAMLGGSLARILHYLGSETDLRHLIAARKRAKCPPQECRYRF